MPEGFLDDPSIGVKWKIYAIINGFWIGGKTCYASNKFFAEKLGVTERQIRSGLAQLEEQYIKRVVKGNSRTILPKAEIVEEEVSLPRGGSPASAEAEVSLPHISVSNSVSKPGEATLRVELDLDKTIKPKKDTSYFSVFELWGKFPLNWRANRTEIDAAQNLLKEHGLEACKGALRFADKVRGDQYSPKIFKPSDLDRKWAELKNYK